MKLLLIGGSGKVASLILPFLKEQHSVRVFDLRAPQDDSVEYQQGSVTDHEALVKATQGMDAVVYMAMGSTDWDTWKGTNSGFDANVKGVHFALKAAADAGITQTVYCSSMSVYSDLLRRYVEDEDVTPDAKDLYGFTKKLGEDVCKNAWRRWGIHVNALRLCHPTARETWLEQTQAGTPTIHTVDEDVANAILAALKLKAGFQAFSISGDYENKIMNMARAKQLLKWEPLARPVK